MLPAVRRQRADGHSVVHGLKTTWLPNYMEHAAYFATFWRRGRYDRTYPAYVEDAVTAALTRASNAVETWHAHRR